MPELPDVTVYVESIAARVAGQPLQGIRVASPFVVRTVDPPLAAASGKRIQEVRRLGKRIVFVLEDGLFLVVHLMIAGRFKWLEPRAKIPGKVGLAAFDFPSGTLLLTEAATKKRASIHLARSLDEFKRPGIEPLQCTLEEFDAALRRENHTLKRALTDPRLFSGIGNAYSDEILHRARLSPALLTRKMSPADVQALFEATRGVLGEWTARLREEARERFPEKVTAFRDDFAVHGKYRKACPVCGTAVQRVAYADNETNYCPRCQTAGKLLSDRSLARLLHEDWPRTIEELEERFPARGK
ncbi:MAG TPA: DNA-formamidopyrimidine glycosylase family protein [Myxococcales bacterium]|nr:DNA-formamidopyrimidine glycosylase family protein [Myxococcales bacterium]